MARTRGAKDLRKRKLPATRPIKSPASPIQTQRTEAQSASVAERAELPQDDFKAALAAELGKAAAGEQSASPGPGQSGDSLTADSTPAPGFDPNALTLDGLANAWRLPFYGLARLLQWLKVAPDPEPIEAVGRRRAKELAKASYPIWEYYARQYVDVHPDQAVNVAIGVTALDGIGIIPDLIDAVSQSRKRSAPKAAVPACGPAASSPA